MTNMGKIGSSALRLSRLT